MDSRPLRLLVEGWRFIPHSYAIVNQYQCLELLRRDDVMLRHRDVPFFNPGWKIVAGLWDADIETTLRAVPTPGINEPVDAILRIDYPHRMQSVPGVRTFVFITSEVGCLPKRNIADNRSISQWMSESDVSIITPSQWSKRGLMASGVDASRIHVVPHGIDPNVFHPLPTEQRSALRNNMDAREFCFLNVGAMTGSKNIAMLLKALAVVVVKQPNVRLILKGMDMLYNSQQLLQQHAASLSPAEWQSIEGKITYIGRPFSFKQIAELYQACDAYVTPYSGEGFNMPALEAVASGLPLICTRGGPTDDFTTDEFALYINSTERVVKIDEANGVALVPSSDHLIEQMLRVIEDRTTRERAETAGVAFARENFSWARVVDRLVKTLGGAEKRVGN